MIDLSALKGSSFVVLGLARSGLATGRALTAARIDCIAWDDNEASRKAGVPLICDVELLARVQTVARYVAVTGTNGKSTTTALIGHILKKAGVACEVGGNIGRGALDLGPLGASGVYVLAMSSFQLEVLPS